MCEVNQTRMVKSRALPAADSSRYTTPDLTIQSNISIVTPSQTSSMYSITIIITLVSLVGTCIHT